MSRASAGFADFFPTAPWVLQQKQRRAAIDRQQSRSKSNAKPTPTGAPADADVVSTTTTPPPPLASAKPTTAAGSRGGSGAPGGNPSGEVNKPEPHAHVADDNDSLQGDLLNAVGSASSHASTVSSVFSGPHQLSAGASLGRPSHANASTPLTNAESSPQDHACNSPRSKSASMARAMNAQQDEALRKDHSPAGPPTRVQLIRQQARDLGGSVQGEICTYDPELDKKLSSKERRKTKPVYRQFGSEVGCPALERPRPENVVVVTVGG